MERCQHGILGKGAHESGRSDKRSLESIDDADDGRRILGLRVERFSQGIAPGKQPLRERARDNDGRRGWCGAAVPIEDLRRGEIASRNEFYAEGVQRLFVT